MVLLQGTRAVLRPLLDFVKLFAESQAKEDLQVRAYGTCLCVPVHSVREGSLPKGCSNVAACPSKSSCPLRSDRFLQKGQSSEHMQRLLERLCGMSVEGFSCRQDMEEEFDKIFSDTTSAGQNILSPETSYQPFWPFWQGAVGLAQKQP